MSRSSAQELLRRHGIAYMATRNGRYTTNCPWCLGPYLSVKIDDGGACWFCRDCQCRGPEPAAAGNGRATNSLGKPTAVYPYEDELGRLLFEVLRFEPTGGPKQFRQRAGPDQQKWSIKGVRIGSSDDISDWFERGGGTVETLWAAVERLPDYALADDMPPPDNEPPPAHPPDEPARAEPEPKHVPVPLLRVSDWEGVPVPKREWTVPDRIPVRNVALLSGEGAVGKDILTLQLAVAHVLARDWFGTMPTPGPVLYLNCEDEPDELHRRLDVIRTSRAVRLADLNDLHLWSLVGQDAVLAAPDRRGTLMQRTARFRELRERVLDIRPVLVVASSLADVFAGNENDRSQTRQFVTIMRGLGMEANCAALLIAHPSLSGIATDSGLSGSTAWHNSIRARGLLKTATVKTATADDDSEPDPDLRVLEWRKNSYGPLAEQTQLRWKLIEGTRADCSCRMSVQARSSKWPPTVGSTTCS
jgi:AAA domain